MLKKTYHIKILLTGILVLTLSGGMLAQTESYGITWLSLEEAIESAKNDPKKVMLFMEAEWCTLCKKMKKEVFPDSEIQTMINNNFYAVRIDIESNESIIYEDKKWTKKELSKDFGLYATPTFIFLDSDESMIGNKPGYMDREEFMDLLTFVANEEYIESEF
jgi:thioredoxin-related protein